MFQLICKDGHARRGAFTTPHGTVQTPVFMNVGTQAAIKGALSAEDLETIGCQVELSNTYHLHVRPGDELIRDLGGLHKFMTWEKPILTDSGGFQIFSLAQLRKITEEGVAFNCHVDGRHIFMGPEESMRIQANLGSDIAMAFDECIKIPSPYDYVKDSCDRTYRWLQRCKAALTDYTGRDDAVNPGQVLFGINQGTIFHDLRIEHMKKIADLDLAGYAIGGLQPDGTPLMRELERVVMLRVVDEYWMDHLEAMDDLRQGIGLRAYGNVKPVDEYKRAGFDMFDEMVNGIQSETVRRLFTVRVRREQKLERKTVARSAATNAGGDDSEKKRPVRRVKKPGRNDPCPCGKLRPNGLPMKYKDCCGKNA